MGKSISGWARRTTLVTLGILVVATATVITSDAATSPTYWPQPQADAALSNHVVGETALTSTTDANLAPLMSFGIVPSFGDCGGQSGAPVANATTLFYYDGRALNAVTLATGKTIWRQDVAGHFGEAALVTSLAVAGSTLYVAKIVFCDKVSDADGEIDAVNAKTGAVLWSQHTEEPISTMVLSGTTLLDWGADSGAATVAAHSTSTGALIWAKSDCQGVFVVATVALTDCGALAVTTGAVKWQKPGWTFWRGDGTGTTSPQIYATDASGHLTALNSAGATVWSSPTEKGPVLCGGPARIYVTCDSTALCALNRTTGVRQWKDASDNPTSVAIAADVVYPTPGQGPVDADMGAVIQTGNFYGDLSTARGAQVANGRLFVEVDRNLDVFSLS